MKNISIVLAAVLVLTALTLTSCGGMDNGGAADGTVTVTLDSGKSDSGMVSDTIIGTGRNMR